MTDLVTITKLERIIKEKHLKRDDIPLFNFEEYVKSKETKKSRI